MKEFKKYKEYEECKERWRFAIVLVLVLVLDDSVWGESVPPAESQRGVACSTGLSKPCAVATSWVPGVA